MKKFIIKFIDVVKKKKEKKKKPEESRTRCLLGENGFFFGGKARLGNCYIG